MTAVSAAAEAVVFSVDAGRFHAGDATLVGLHVLATDIVSRLRAARPATKTGRQRLAGVPSCVDETLSIARGPRPARQADLGTAALRSVKPQA